jgi:hypothetical protein
MYDLFIRQAAQFFYRFGHTILSVVIRIANYEHRYSDIKSRSFVTVYLPIYDYNFDPHLTPTQKRSGRVKVE